MAKTPNVTALPKPKRTIVPPTTPGTLRARIIVLNQLLGQCRPDSEEAWRINQRIAYLERELHEMEAKATA